MSEQWKTLPGFPNYEISTKGHIRSLNYHREGRVKELKQALNTCGYPYVNTFHKGKNLVRTVHRWMAMVFLDLKPGGLEVNHKNGVKTDNQLENLELVTRSENMKHAYSMGLSKKPPNRWS